MSCSFGSPRIEAPLTSLVWITSIVCQFSPRDRDVVTDLTSLLAGASAFEELLDEQHGRDVRVFVIWEPVLPSHLFAPSTSSLKRMSDSRVAQYWDKSRLASRPMGETDHNSSVWDYVAVYEPGKLWDKAPPEAAYSGNPVVDVIDEARSAIRRLGEKRLSKSDLRMDPTTSEQFKTSHQKPYLLSFNSASILGLTSVLQPSKSN